MGVGLKYQDSEGNYEPVGRGPKGEQGEQGIQGPPGPSLWGGISGDIANQTDLQAALAEKIQGVNIGKITVSDTEPDSPSEGDVWIDPTATPPPFVPPAGSITPAMRAGGFATGNIDLVTLGTAGAFSITGLGFKPKMVRFFLRGANVTTQNVQGQGVMDENGNQSATASSTRSSDGLSIAVAATNRCFIRNSASSTTLSLEAEYVSMDADGFTVNIVAASAAGTSGITWEAYS